MTAILFWLLALVSLGSAVLVVTHRSPLYAALFLVVTLIAQAGLFVLLGATFVAVIQVLIYAGAVMILFLFVVMSLETEPRRRIVRGSLHRTAAALALAVLCGTLLLQTWSGVDAPRVVTAAELDVAEVGQALYGPYLIPFLAGSLLLTVTVLGAVLLARKEPP